jgi:cell division transport system ATP-binding protein
MGVGQKVMIELVDVRLDHPRGGQPLVAGANLKVDRGEVVMIVGAAGVGTSRLVAAALGELATNAGRVEVFGRDVSKLRRSSLRMMRRRIGIVPQDLCLLGDRSVQLNVMLPLEIDGIPRSISLVRANAAMQQLALENDAEYAIEELSGAAKQRVAVARALVRDPALVIADHPTSMQDAAGAELVASALAEAAIGGAAVIALGRDPALREIAERRGWRMLGLVDGELRSFAELPAPVAAIDELLIDVASELPSAGVSQPESVPNLLPFPLSARTAGVA